jgi:phosphopantothenoylcysteine decarboxylase/phosphopantothenate--cysteine ligase
MGFALAEAAVAAGCKVTLIAGPVALPTPEGVTRIDIESARDLLAAVEAALPEADIYISTAAIADWRPETYSPTKLKKATMDGVIRLVPNPDVLKTIRPLKGNRLFVGFAAETGEPTQEATRKMREKGLDMIVANDVTATGAGFAVDTNRVTLLFPDLTQETLPLMTKRALATTLIERILNLHA